MFRTIGLVLLLLIGLVNFSQHIDTVKINVNRVIEVNYYNENGQVYRVEEIKNDTLQKITTYNQHWGTYTIKYPVIKVDEEYSSNKILLKRNTPTGSEKYTSKGVLYEQKFYRSCPTCADSLYQYNEDDGIITSIERNYVEGKFSKHLVTYSSENEGLVLGERFEYRDTSFTFFEYEYDDLSKRYYYDPFNDYRDSVNIYSEQGGNLTGTMYYSFYQGKKYPTKWKRDKLVTHYYYDQKGILIDSATIKQIASYANRFDELPYLYWNKYEPFSNRPIFKLELYEDLNIKSYARYTYDEYRDNSEVLLASFDQNGNGELIELKKSGNDYFTSFENGDKRTTSSIERANRESLWSDSSYYVYGNCELNEKDVSIRYASYKPSGSEIYFDSEWHPLIEYDFSGSFETKVIYDYDSLFRPISINYTNERDPVKPKYTGADIGTSYKFEAFNTNGKSIYFYLEDENGRVIKQYAYNHKGNKLRYDMLLDTIKNEGHERIYSPKGKLQWENQLTNAGYEGWVLELPMLNLFDYDHNFNYELELLLINSEDFFTRLDWNNNRDSVWYTKSHYQNGKRNGSYYGKGGASGQYVNGMKTGTWTEVSWINGRLGIGNIYTVGQYEDNLKTGLWVQTFENRDTLNYETYLRDTLNGDTRIYDEYGRFVETRGYAMGKSANENLSGSYVINKSYMHGQVINDKREGQWKMKMNDGWGDLDFQDDEPKGMYYWLSFDLKDTLELAQISGGTWDKLSDYRGIYGGRYQKVRGLMRNGLTIYKGDSLLFEENQLVGSLKGRSHKWDDLPNHLIILDAPATYEYYDNGFRFDFISGRLTDYHENGQIKMEGYLKDGNKSGIWKFYHSNGKLKKTGTYYQDEETGNWEYFDEYAQPLKQESKSFGITREETGKLYTNIILPPFAKPLTYEVDYEFIVNSNNSYALLNTTTELRSNDQLTPTFELINLTENKIVKHFTSSTIPYYPGMPMSLIALSNNGRYMAAYRPYEADGNAQAQFDDTLYVYDLSTEEIISQCYHRDQDYSLYSRMEKSDKLSLSFANHDSTLVLTTNSTEIIKFNTLTGQQIKKDWVGNQDSDDYINSVSVYPEKSLYMVEQGNKIYHYDLNSLKLIETETNSFSNYLPGRLYLRTESIGQGKKSDLRHTLYSPAAKDSISFSQRAVLQQINKKLNFIGFELLNARMLPEVYVLWFYGSVKEHDGQYVRVLVDKIANKVVDYNLTDFPMINEPLVLNSNAIYIYSDLTQTKIEDLDKVYHSGENNSPFPHKYNVSNFAIEPINAGSSLEEMEYAVPNKEKLEIGKLYSPYDQTAFTLKKHLFNLSTLSHDSPESFSMTRKDDFDEVFYSHLDSLYYLSNKKYISDSIELPDYLSSGKNIIAESNDRFMLLDNNYWDDYFNAVEFVNDKKSVFLEKFVKLSIIDTSDYIFYCPDRYYYASQNAGKKIYFESNLKNYPFEQFDLKYNRPDIVLDRLGYADSSLVTAYHQAYLKRLKKMGFTEEMLKDDFHLPEIEIRNFESMPTLFDQKDIDLNLHLEDSKYPLDRINIWVNDVAILGTNGISLRELNTQELDKTVSIPLAKGKNKIQISVLNQAGAESYKETIELECAAGKEQPDLYLITIGESEFQQSDFNLTYAAKDAKDVATLFSQSKVYGEVFSKTLTNNEVTRDHVLELKSFLATADINDHVIIFLAGHGVLSADLDYYLATYAMDFNKPEERGLMYEDLESLLDGIKPLSKTLIIDACHSGEIDKEEMELAVAENSEAGDVQFRAVNHTVKSKLGSQNTLELTKSLFTDLRKGTGATVISSAGGLEFAMESGDWQNGLFTYVLINGIKSGNADLNNDGEIWLSELQEYVSNEVTRMSNGLQQPTSRIENQMVDFRVW